MQKYSCHQNPYFYKMKLDFIYQTLQNDLGFIPRSRTAISREVDMSVAVSLFGIVHEHWLGNLIVGSGLFLLWVVFIAFEHLLKKKVEGGRLFHLLTMVLRRRWVFVAAGCLVLLACVIALSAPSGDELMVGAAGAYDDSRNRPDHSATVFVDLPATRNSTGLLRFEAPQGRALAHLPGKTIPQAFFIVIERVVGENEWRLEGKLTCRTDRHNVRGRITIRKANKSLEIELEVDGITFEHITLSQLD